MTHRERLDCTMVTVATRHGDFPYRPDYTRWQGPSPGDPPARMTKVHPLGPATRRLYDLIEGTPVPCQRTPGLWLSEHEADHVAAAHGCRRCPLLDACVAARDEPGARWAGVVMAGRWMGQWGIGVKDTLTIGRHRPKDLPRQPRDSGTSGPQPADSCPAYDPAPGRPLDGLPA